MNGRTFLKLGALVLMLGVTLVGVAQATTYYVNVVSGLDGKNGLSPTVGPDPIGPKQTINNAIAAASAGDTIIVDYGFGNLYNETVTVNKRLVFGVSSNNGSGTPQVVTGIVNITTASPNNTCTFTGPYQFRTALTLTLGSVVGGNNVTVGLAATTSTVTRTAGTVDAQLNYLGTVNFVYDGGAAITSGFELPPAANTTNFNNLTTTATPLTLNESKTMNGVLTTSSTLSLGGNTLTLVSGSTAVAHSVGAAVSSGTLAFTLGSGAVSVAGAFALPNVSASKSTSTLNTLTLTAATSTGALTANTNANITVTAATTVGAVSLTGAGTITLTAATTIASISNSGSGTVTVTPAGTVTGSVTLSGTGFITFAGAMTVGANVSLTSALAISGAGAVAQITFPDAATTVSGTVTNSATFSGTVATATTYTNAGVIYFNATTVAVSTGGVVNSSSSTHGLTDGTSFFTANGDIRFASTTGSASLGSVTNSSSYGSGATSSGRIVFTGRTSGTVTAGAVLNSSGTTSSSNGAIDFAVASTGSFSGGSVSSTGASGGDITFGNGPFSVSGSVSSSRTATGADIIVGGGAGAANGVSVGGNLSNSGASNITFPMLTIGAFAVTGTLGSSGTGTIAFTANATGPSSISLGGVNISAGTISLIGNGALTTNVTVNGPASFTGGTFNTTTSAARTLQLGGLSNTFSGLATRTDFVSTSTTTTLLIQPTLVVAAQTVTGNALTSVWYGPLVINNISGLQPFITISGGNFRVLNNVSFTTTGAFTGGVAINGVTLFIGGQLAPFAGAGNFANASGYTTDATGFVSMNGNAGQTVSGAGTFGNFEMDATGQTVTFSGGLGPFVGTFNLTAGTTSAAGNINFNNTTNPPTIVRNAGTFDVAPTFTSAVNVTYIGLDKTTALELPVATNRLNNLTVATTNGALVAGQGTVNVGVATTVNGTLTINPGQALLLNGVSLTMNGASVVLNGDLANVASTDQLVLNSATGTTITGAGVLPDITVAVGSTGNWINGATGLATGLLGGNNLRGGGDDINPGLTGNITFGGGTASLTASFGTANSTTTAHLATINTSNSGNTFTLGAGLVVSGSLTHAAGTVDVGAYTFTHRGAAPTFTGGSATVGTTGKLSFVRTTTVVGVDVLFSAVTSDVTIAANVEVNMASNTAGSDIWQLNDLTAGNLILAGTLTITRGTVQLGSAATARNLTITGTALTMASGTSFNTTGIGTLRLNATTPPLTMTYSGTPTIARLRVSNDVVLAGTGTALTVNAVFTHDGGNLNFGSRTLTVSGTFTRSAGTYTANAAALSIVTGGLTGGGWLVIAGGSFTQGTGFSIPNLRIASAASFAAGSAADFSVTGVFDLQNGTGNTFTHTVGGAARLNIANGAIVNYGSGTLDVAPVYGGTITLVAANTSSSSIPATVWPATPATLVSDFYVASGFTVSTPAGSRTVTTLWNLISGVLNLNTNTTTLVISNNATIRRQEAASVTALTTGAITFGTGINVWYEPAAGGAMTTGPELPGTVNNLTFTRIVANNTANSTTFIASHVTVNGTLTIRNNVTGAGGTITAMGNVVVANDANTAATGPIMTFDPFGAFGTPLTFAGTVNQTLTLNGNRTIDWLQLSQQAGSVLSVTIAQGTSATPVNLTITAAINFVNGLLVTGPNTVILPTVVQGFNRFVTAGNWSHIVGNVRKNPGAFFVGRLEYPLGTAGTPPAYRPVAMTFLLADPLITAAGIIFNHVNSPPLGTVGFPIDAGNFISLTSAAPFYWLGVSTVGLGPSQTFDLELMAEGYTTYQSGSFGINQLRIVRRFDGSELTNRWVLQGGTNYSNFITNVPVPGTPIVRVIGSQGGIEPQASRFTIGRGFITAVEKDPKGIPTEYNLSQNYPNPFNPTTLINFDLPKQSPVTLDIFDMLGQKVNTLINGEMMDPGYYKVSWNGTNQSGAAVASGVYYYRIVADKFVSLKKMIFLK